ncbi:MAG: SBBP repeat-containing protein, partial [Verrucomicrobiia bacterium]
MKHILCAGLAIGLMVLAAAAQTAKPFGSMPLYFEANRGQADHSMPFLARGRDSEFLISPTEAQIVLRKEAAEPETVRMQFMGANPQAQIRGDSELSGKINYLVGNDPAQWHAGVPIFAKVRVEEIYPGIGLVYYGNQQQLEYDFNVAPGANPDAMQIHFDGVDKITINAQGELILGLNGGEIRQPKPIIYQMANGARREIDGGYRLENTHTVAFAIGNYDHTLPLVIDPILNYSTFFGGNAGEIAWAVKVVNVGTNGYVYVAGQTFSSKFTNNVPLSTPGAYQTNYNGGTQAGDAFVAKFDSLGSNLLYFTYLGGSGDDAAYALTVDTTGDAYVTGYTVSTNFPVTNAIPGGAAIGGPVDRFSHTYLADAFVAELGADGSNLIYSTYLGGAGADAAYGIALDSSNNAYVTGFTYSTNFPTSTNAFQKHLGVTNSVFSSYYNANAFVSEIGAGGTNLLYSSFLGGTNYDWGRGIAVDSSNYIYVTGFTASTNFPTTNAVQQQLISVTYTTNSAPTNEIFTTNIVNGYLLNGATNQTFNYDAFVTKFNPSFAGLVYSTFLGGTNNDEANSIAVDSVG